MAPEFHLFLPQMRMPFEAIVARAQAAEAAGFTGIAFMDHLAPPAALDQPMYEAMVTATWVAAHTERLRIGHLVLCDALRHPAVLARQAVSLDHASGGRFELGIGWGSVPEELATFGVEHGDARQRADRLAETVEVLKALWSGDPVEFEGTYHHLTDARQRPTPLGPIPIVIGGVGRRTLALVSRHADWWNVPLDGLSRLDALRPSAGDARVSIQQLVTFVPREARRAEITAAADRRFGFMPPTGRVVGDASALVEHFGALHATGVERVYTWFTDFAEEETLAGFGAEVVAAFP